MRKSFIVGAVATLMLIAGVTVAWVGLPEGKVALRTPSAVAQLAEDAATEPALQTANQAIADSGQSAIKQAIATTGPAVVRVDVVATIDISDRFSDFLDDPFFRRFFNFDEEDLEQEAASVGSGVVFGYAGEKLVLTNAHVVDAANEIELTDIDGNTYTANVIGSDTLLDVAVLRIEEDASALSAATLGDSDTIEIGDWAIAIGNPLGLSYTVTLGIISAFDRDVEKPNGVGYYTDLIQTDAAINPGNSGGPLVNALGEVIGINTLIARTSSSGVTVEGINFAIGINAIKDILGQLVETGIVARGWLGVRNTDLNEDLALEYEIDPSLAGALIVHVFTGDPADQAGIEVGDLVVRIGDVTIASAEELGDTVAALGAGAVVDFEIVRGGERQILTVTLGERPAEELLADYQGQVPDSEQAWGITVGPITPVVAQHLGLNSTDGVVIMGIAAGSRAAGEGLREGDVIVEVNHQPVTTVREWSQAVSGIEELSPITLTIVRNGTLLFVTI